MVMLLGDHIQLYHVTPQAKNNRAIELLSHRTAHHKNGHDDQIRQTSYINKEF